MPIERDPESTAFDARPWGGQQRLVPLAARFARGTAAPQPEVSGVIAASAATEGEGEGEGFRERPTIESIPVARVSHPIETESTAVPSLTPGTLAAPSTSLPTVAMRAQEIPTDINPAQPAFIPVVRYPAVAMAPVSLPMPVPAIAVSAARRAPRAVPAFSVKHGCALGGFVVPHLPKVAEVFRTEDATMAVRRRPLTARSMVAIPVGAVLATVAILIIYLAHPAQATTAPSMAAAAVSSEPHVMKVTLEAPAPVVAAPAPIVAAPAPVAVEPTVPAAVDSIAAMETAEARVEAPASHHRSRASKHRKPHRIVAVDASTPLGNLRPSR
jgi:hypothetical protein